jgi:hypothetical protein
MFLDHFNALISKIIFLKKNILMHFWMKNILKNNHNYSQTKKKNHIFSEIAILIILRSLTVTFESLQNY